jgi:D-arabinose 1-dehydrogenase-like Zn-dependent alcohol dehydrogenase
LERVAPLLSDGVSVYSALKKYTNQKTKLVIVGYNSLGNLALRISKAFGVKNISVVGTSDQE